MCVDVSYQMEREIKYARHVGVPEEEIAIMESMLKRYQGSIEYTPKTDHISAFTHDEIPIVTGNQPRILQYFEIGLVPNWVKDASKADKLRKGTINARSETIFELPSFKESIRQRRCLITLDGFFEHHHLNKSKRIPFYIWRTDSEPIVMAGIYDFAVLDNIHVKSVAIVTTKGNDFMAKIHNKDEVHEPHEIPDPRMPVILEKEDFEKWLSGDDYATLMKPLPDGKLRGHTVEKLRTKYEIISHPEITTKFFYPDLPKGVDSIGTNKQLGLF